MDQALRDTVTLLLDRIGDGDASAEERLFCLLRDELDELARAAFRRAGPNATLQPTAIVHDAYLRLARSDRDWQGRSHFLAVAAKAMRHLVVDRARKRATRKRGGEWDRVTLDAVLYEAEERQVDLVALGTALEKLRELDPRQANVVELRFFAGLSVEESAKVLGISKTTVKEDWRGARAWLRRELSQE